MKIYIHVLQKHFEGWLLMDRGAKILISLKSVHLFGQLYLECLSTVLLLEH